MTGVQTCALPISAEVKAGPEPALPQQEEDSQESRQGKIPPHHHILHSNNFLFTNQRMVSLTSHIARHWRPNL